MLIKPKALVTGASGLVGSAAVEHLCAIGWDVVGVDNNQRGKMFGPNGSTLSEGTRLALKYSNFRIADADIRDEAAMKAIFERRGPFDLIIHAAAQPAHEYSTDHALEDFSINATGTMILLETYRQLSPLATFIHVSSSKVYGDSVNTLPLKEYKLRYDLPRMHKNYKGMEEEDMRLDGDLHSLFGASKACGDIMAKEYGTYFKLPIVIFRPVCITGKAHRGVPLHGYLAYLVKCIADGTEYKVNGYLGRQVRDNIHASDLVSAFYEVFLRGVKTPGKAYNIGGGREGANSINEAIIEAEALLNKDGNISYTDLTRRGDHKWCVYSSKRFKKDYPGWKPKHNIHTIMRELVDANS